MFGYLASSRGFAFFVYGIVEVMQGDFCHGAWRVWDFNLLCVMNLEY